MTRLDGRWVPDGRAKAITADCEASLEALDGLPIDLYLLHAPDPRTPWRTSVRSLARLVDQGLVRRVGLANVTRTQLDEALKLAPIAGVQVAERHGATAAETALAWLIALSPAVVAIPGARRPESARSAARAATLRLGEEDEAVLTEAFRGAGRAARGQRPGTSGRPGAEGEVVMVMGIPGAGKSRLASSYIERGYVRLNRDERGGSLRALAGELDDRLTAGVRRAVLDNTYLTRAYRSHVVEAAQRHSLSVRCVWLDTPLAQAQVNLVLRLLERFGSLPMPHQVREAARQEPWLILPTAQMRALRQLEPPSIDEGFTAMERIPFARVSAVGGRSCVLVSAAATTRPGIVEALAGADRDAPHLLFDWTPDAGENPRRPLHHCLGRRGVTRVDGLPEAQPLGRGGGEGQVGPGPQRGEVTFPADEICGQDGGDRALVAALGRVWKARRRVSRRLNGN